MLAALERARWLVYLNVKFSAHSLPRFECLILTFLPFYLPVVVVLVVVVVGSSIRINRSIRGDPLTGPRRDQFQC